MRRFTIYTEPWFADPAWFAPVTEEIPDHPEGGVRYSNAQELFTVAIKLQYDLGVESGRTEEGIRVQKYLQGLGWTSTQIRTLMFWKPGQPITIL
jgi:hypothetical protein